MRLQILHAPDCPGAEALDSRLTPLLAIRTDIEVTRQVVTTEDDARRLRMTGSPTILADGADLFTHSGQQPSLSCRLYPDEHGHLGQHPRPPSSAKHSDLASPDRRAGRGYQGRYRLIHLSAGPITGRSCQPRAMTSPRIDSAAPRSRWRIIVA